jgi:hypothetical protein
MTSATDLAKMVPGFDFLQGLMKNAGAGLPNFGQWIAPTLDPKELDKRIDELRTVQFWLEQNVRMLAATIQALEVQRMTLSTLQTMNLPLTNLREALTLPAVRAAGTEPDAAPSPAPAFPFRSAIGSATVDAPAPAAAPAPKARSRAGRRADAASPARPSMIDPMQWWGALTQQFAQLAANAIKDSATDAARQLSGAVVQQSIDAGGQALRKAADVATDVATAPAKVAAQAAGVATGVATSVASGLGAGGAGGVLGALEPAPKPAAARRRGR